MGETRKETRWLGEKRLYPGQRVWIAGEPRLRIYECLSFLNDPELLRLEERRTVILSALLALNSGAVLSNTVATSHVWLLKN